MEQKIVKVGNVKMGNKLPLSLICGPCQIESREHAIMIAGAMREITQKLGIGYIFKAIINLLIRMAISQSPK